MNMGHFVSCFFGALFLTNAIPHFVSGSMGQPFQSPFAKPPGQGFSSSIVNVFWGFFNLVIAWLLLCRAARFDLQSTPDAATAGTAMLLMSLVHARGFGRFNGGNNPGGPQATR